MLGAIVGDVVGSIYEFENIKTKNFKLITETNFFTDDTVMTLAVANALMILMAERNSEFEDENFKRAVIFDMQRLGHKYKNAGYGGKFYKWLFCTHSDGFPEPYNSLGNGSAMRVSPVAWASDDLETVKRLARLSAEVTHNHPEGIKGAEATATAVFMARTGAGKNEIKNYIEQNYKYDLSRRLDEIRPNYYFNETCQKTVPEAIICYLESVNFEDALRNAISLGGDSDTLAAVTCSIAEAEYKIPDEISNLIFNKLDENLKTILKKFDEWRKI